ncbi:helix-turn-helix domain-containing protein [Parazoarcus communis]|uniref:AraC family transcriptional regulator n=1 Tax=Parazoarcus communis SWub3 = DSM 12120 TaxID=1121029 RepID=A0A323UQX0_9RHOO|nr:helix-turn-helix domain-containing protein [Parazoarcus communis]NMG72326.1 helix-turn-helix domain-containing protein [Parazoarcus communis SWub3 = DSM 12120]PZA14894.1 AraC family transcriptional regulator [Azoarcus communis] [Parazoarcus communis SWub3 = DSM 12120]
MPTLPKYDLYGSEAKPSWLDSFNFEWIPQRSRPFNWEIEPHIHDGLIQVLYVRSGSGEALIDGTRRRIEPPCLIVIPARTVHGFHFTPEVDGPVVTAPQRPLEALASTARPELLSYIRTPAVLPVQAGSRHDQKLVPLFDALAREAAEYEPGQTAAGSALLLAAFVIMERVDTGIQSPRVVTRSRGTAKVERFRALVEQHYKAHLPMESYASELGVSPGQLARLCRETIGMSPLDVINARLIHEAQRELVYSQLSVKQIAGALGFEDEAYFGRFFKKNAGSTALAFREMARAQLARASGEVSSGS